MLSREEVLKLGAGRELDALVAEHVFGWRKIHGPKTDYDGTCESFDVLVPLSIDDPFPLYPPKGSIKPCWFCKDWSTDVKAAWEVVEELNGRYAFEIGRAGEYNEPERKWKARFGMTGWIEADTAPEAICKAALLAIIDKEEEK